MSGYAQRDIRELVRRIAESSRLDPEMIMALAKGTVEDEAGGEAGFRPTSALDNLLHGVNRFTGTSGSAVRATDLIPGLQQGEITKDISELGSMKANLPEDALGSKIALTGLQGVNWLDMGVGMLPALGGITAMPRKQLMNLARRFIRKTEGGEGATVSLRPEIRDPQTGIMVGRGEDSGTEWITQGRPTPGQLSDWLQQQPVNIDDPAENALLGGYLNPKDGNYYIDIPERYLDKYQAQVAGTRRGEDMLWDLDAGQELAIPPGTSQDFIHWSKQPDMTMLDPTRFGEGLQGHDLARKKALEQVNMGERFAPRSYMGQEGVYSREPGLGSQVYTGQTLGTYNKAPDPQLHAEIMAEVDARMAQEPFQGPQFRQTVMEEVLREKGYLGYMNPDTGVIGQFNKTPVNYAGQAFPSYRARPGEVPPMKSSPQYMFERDPMGSTRQAATEARAKGEIPQLTGWQKDPLTGVYTPPAMEKLVPRPNRVGRSIPQTGGQNRMTVENPTSNEPQYPGIYGNPRDIVKRAERFVRPENPLMKQHFGMDRADLADSMLANQQLIQPDQVGIAYPKSDLGAAHVKQVMGDRNVDRLQDLIIAGMDNPVMRNSVGWYELRALRDRFIKVLGPELGDRKFREFAQMGSVLSAKTAPDAEIRLAGTAYNQHQKGDLISGYLDRDIKDISREYGVNLPSMVHGSGSTQVPMRRMLDTGMFYGENPAAKTPYYFLSKTGDNTARPVMDAHYMRGIGMPDVRPNRSDQAVQGLEAGPVSDWFMRDVAAPTGVAGSPAQALLWNVLGLDTGVRGAAQGKLGVPYLELFTDEIQRQSQKTGKGFDQTLDEWILGLGKLGQNVPQVNPQMEMDYEGFV